jgi:hypothetical protein
MRIVEEYTDTNADLIEVKSANYIGDFAIRVFFNDGCNRLVDFKPFLELSYILQFKNTLRKKDSRILKL